MPQNVRRGPETIAFKTKKPKTLWPRAHSEVVAQGQQLPPLVRKVIDQLGVLAVPATNRNLIPKSGNLKNIGGS